MKKRRRSEIRLGIDYEATATQARMSLTPALKFWQLRGPKLVGLGVLLVCVGLIYWLFSHPMFFVYGADISGNNAVSSREIYLTADIHNQSIFWLDPAQVATHISAIPNIKSAVVTVALPGRVGIDVIERRPEMLWQTGNAIWWVDAEGTIVPPKQDMTGMLRIIDDDRQPLEAGYKIDPSLIQGAHTLRMLAPDVMTIRYTRQNGLTVATPDGWAVYLGDGTQLKAKLVVLTALLEELRAEEITPEFIDLRNPLRPFYREETGVIPTPAPRLILPANPPPAGVQPP